MLEAETICGQVYWAFDDSVLYAKDLHLTLLMTVAIPALLFYALLCPVLAFVYLAAHRDRQTNPKLLFRFGLLFSGYSDQYWWYESFIYLRKLCIILIVTFANSNNQQLHIALGILIVWLYLHEHMQPFGAAAGDSAGLTASTPTAATSTASALLHQMEATSLLILILMVWSAVFFVVNPCDDTDTVCSVLGVSVLGANLLFAIVCAYTFVKSFGKKSTLVKRIGGELHKRFRGRSPSFLVEVDNGGEISDNGIVNPLSNGKSRSMFSKLSAKRNSKWEVKDESVIEMAELRKNVVVNR
jgi:hypothetical protein